MLENRMVLDEVEYMSKDEYEEYLEYLYEEDDRRYEDKVFEELGGSDNE